MPYTVSFDPTVGSIQSQIITDATPKRDGIMTAAQAEKLAALVANDGTIAQTYNNGASAADQTAVVTPAKGGQVVVQAGADNTGVLLDVNPFNPVASTLVRFTDNNTQVIRSAVPNGPNAIGTVVDTANDLADPGAVLLGVYNNAVAQLIVKKDFVFVNQTSQDNNSSAGVQLRSDVANRSQYRSSQYGANAGVPGISTIKSRGALGTLAPVAPGDHFAPPQ